MSENRQQRRARERAEKKNQTTQLNSKACYLDTVSYYFEFPTEPDDAVAQKIVKAVSLPTDRVNWSVEDEPDFYMKDDSQSMLRIDIDVRPCRESGGVEGTLDDLDVDQEPDDETPQELLDRVREARKIAAQYGGQLTGGYYESEFTNRPMTWQELEEETED